MDVEYCVAEAVLEVHGEARPPPPRELMAAMNTA